MAEATARPTEVHGAYLDARGWATSATTRRLRWRLRRLPQHSRDPKTLAKRKAFGDELTLRGEVWAR